MTLQSPITSFEHTSEMNGEHVFDIQVETELVASTLRSLSGLLAATTQDNDQDTIVQMASTNDVTALKDLAIPGESHSIDQVVQEAFKVFQHRTRVNHPRFMGLIPSPTSPVAWLGDVIAGAFNALGASKLQASGPVAVEKRLIDWLCSKVGWDEASQGGVFVSGGSMANMMSLVLARDRYVPLEKRADAVAYLSTDTHYSVAKAFRILGFLPGQVRRVATNANFQMDVDALRKTVKRDREAGLLPFLVVATCGTTNTGAVDPLEKISQVCRSEDMWLHVDGAYGASVALSTSHVDRVSGLKWADSITWDAHKWLFQTYSCGILLVKDKTDLLRSFANDGDYLRDGAAMEDEDVPNFWNYSIELTRPSRRAMKLWFTLRVLGLSRIGSMIDHAFALAETAEGKLRELPNWEILSSSVESLAIVTFRCAPTGWTESDLDVLNSDISKTLLGENIVGIFTTKVRGVVALRICALSPYLSLEKMSSIVLEIDGVAKHLMAKDVQA